MRTALLSVLVLAMVASTAYADAVIEGKVTDLLGKPVPNVRVHVLTGPDQQVVTTDKDGHYQVIVDGNQKVSMVIGAGERLTFRRGQIKDGTRQRVNFELEIADGEIIRIIDDKPATVPPKLKLDGPRVTPPYSDEAVERDAWAKAWLLLDISETGKVARVKLVKRPGFDLDEIAVKEAMKLQFAPALDEHGKPMRTSIFWAMEWPSHGWLVEHGGTATRMPEESYEVDIFSTSSGAVMTRSITSGPDPDKDARIIRGSESFLDRNQAPQNVTNMNKSLSSVRCAGTGPLNLDQRYPVYRDCSRPNPKKLPYLPWLDGTQPIPPDPPEIAEKPEAPLHLTRASYVPQITASAATAVLLAGWIYSFVEKNKYENRVLAYHSVDGPGNATRFTSTEEVARYNSDRDNWQRWQKISTIGAIAVIGTGGVTALLWFRHQRKADFSVQPESGGASVTLGGRF